MTSLLMADALELCDTNGQASGEKYWFETHSAGASYGEPQPIEVAINSLLRDGALTETQSVGNREVTLIVCVQATNGLALAEGIAALHRTTGTRTTLVWTSDDEFAPPTVFLVETSSLHNPGDHDDFGWLNHRQLYRLRLVCLPYTRSVGEIVDEASSPPGAGAGTVFYTADSTTGWDTFGGGSQAAKLFAVDSTIKVSGTGAVRSRVTDFDPGSISGTENGTGGFYRANGGFARDEVSVSLDTDTGGYASIAVRFDPFFDASKLVRIWQSTAPGKWTEVDGWAAIKVEANGYVHYRWAVDADLAISALRFESEIGTVGQHYGLAAPDVWYDDFRIATTATTDQSIVKQLFVEGSAPTPGSLHIGSGSDDVALGPVLLITMPAAAMPAGFNPEARPWVTQGTLTADATALHDSYFTPDPVAYSTSAGRPIFNPPARMLTAGPYTLVSLVKSDGDDLTVGVQAQLDVDGTLTGPTSQAEVNIPAGPAGWLFVPVGTVYLPPVPVEGADETTTVRLLCKGAPVANIYMVPAWQVRGRPVADFSIIDCGSGAASAAGSSSHLWIDPPSPRQTQGGWWRGPTPDRLNSRAAWSDVRKPGAHQFPAGDLSAFLIAGAQAPTLALRYYPAWWGPAAR